MVKEKFEIFGVYTFPPKSDTPINLGHKMMGALPFESTRARAESGLSATS